MHYDLMLNEISQTEKDKYCMALLMYGINKQTKPVNKINKSSHRYREQEVTSGEREVRGNIG